MDVHRLGPDKLLNNTVGEYFRDQGLKIVIFVIPSVVRIMGKDSDDSSSVLCFSVVSLKSEKKYNIPGPNLQICR